MRREFCMSVLETCLPHALAQFRVDHVHEKPQALGPTTLVRWMEVRPQVYLVNHIDHSDARWNIRWDIRSNNEAFDGTFDRTFCGTFGRTFDGAFGR